MAFKGIDSTFAAQHLTLVGVSVINCGVIHEDPCQILSLSYFARVAFMQVL